MNYSLMQNFSTQDRTAEFRSIVSQFERKLTFQSGNRVTSRRSKLLSSVKSSLTDNSAAAAPPNHSQSPDVISSSVSSQYEDSSRIASNELSTPPQVPRHIRTEFARNAANIGRGISLTMEKLHQLAQLAQRKSLFDDRSAEINRLIFVIKQDLEALNQKISSLQLLARNSANSSGKTWLSSVDSYSSINQQSEHNNNVVVMLQGKLADVGNSFKNVLELRTKNIQASRSRTENFISTVGAAASMRSINQVIPSRNLPNTLSVHGTPSNSEALTKRRLPADSDSLSLDPNAYSSSSGQSVSLKQQQQLWNDMEEARPLVNPNGDLASLDSTQGYLHQRGEAIEMIEKTIHELGGMFSQLSAMVAQQGDVLQRIDANTDDIVSNVTGAHEQLIRYWHRMSRNRSILLKFFGILMIVFLIWVLAAG